MKKYIRWAVIAIAIPIVLFLILVVLLYCPPVQNWAVKRVASYASQKMGMNITVDRVKLVFPLDLGIEGVRVLQPNDSISGQTDTIANVGKIVANVQLLPLLSNQVEVNELSLHNVRMNTANIVHEARIKGNVGLLLVQSRGVDLKSKTIRVNQAQLKDANISVELSDTVPPDTTKTPVYWKIKVDKLQIEHSKALLRTPRDSMAVLVDLPKLDAQSPDVVEALNSALLGLNKNDEVRVNIVHSGVGAVSESDIMLATASKAIVIAFNVRPDANARRLADTEDVDIRTYRVIYDALNDVKDAMSGMLKPKYKEVIQGRVEIRQVMRFSKALVAGSYVLEGKIHNNSKIRILRDNVELFDGEIDSLRRFKDEVKEVAAGYECGISIVDFRDFTEGDIIEAYTMEEIETSIAEANKAAEQKREAQAAAAAEAEESAAE